MTTTVRWPLGNGKFLPFEVYCSNEDWNDVPGLYIFAIQEPPRGDWHSLYVGQADSFSKRLPNHERWHEAVRNGATHIHAIVVKSQSDRDLWERMLIQHLQPPMNIQHRRVV